MSTPPSGGQPPFGQQQPFGQPSFDQQRFDQQQAGGPAPFPTGQPFDQQPGGPAPFPTAQPHNYGQAPKPRLSRRLIIRLVVLGVIVIVGIGVWIYTSKTDPGGSQVGDCLSGNIDNTDSIKKTDCSGTDVAYKVVGRVDNQTQDVDATQACSSYPSADVGFWEQSSQGSSTGALLCLQTVKH